jgi:aspartyl-tRNA(Asn)/glutamyl-tRNA(Gln) amidotransferase subunit A
VRLGICRDNLLENLHPDVERCFQEAVRLLEKRFGNVREIHWPLLDQVSLLGNVIAFAEAASIHEEWVRKQPEDYSREVLSRLRLGMTFLATDYLRGQRLRSPILAQGEEVFRGIDLLVYPTLPFAGARIGAETVATSHGEEDVRVASIRLNRLGNLTGYPAISIPCGLTPQNLPVGLQLMAAPFQESIMLQVAHWYERETAWHESAQWLAISGQ